MKLNGFCDLRGLLLNMTKSTLFVFRRGGIVKNIEKCYFKGFFLKLSPCINIYV